jgi:hypothetical protein
MIVTERNCMRLSSGHLQRAERLQHQKELPINRRRFVTRAKDGTSDEDSHSLGPLSRPLGHDRASRRSARFRSLPIRRRSVLRPLRRHELEPSPSLRRYACNPQFPGWQRRPRCPQAVRPTMTTLSNHETIWHSMRRTRTPGYFCLSPSWASFCRAKCC